MQTSVTTLPSQRALFDIPRDVAYFNCSYFSPQMRSVTEAGLQAIRRKERPWEFTVDDFFEDSRRLRAQLARLLTATPSEIALVPSVSYGIGVAAANLPVGAGREVVTLAEQFPSNVYPWRAATATQGGSVRVVDRPADGLWTEPVLNAIGRNTAVVALPEFHWADGTPVDLVAVGARCREVGAALVLDLTQSLGALPFSVRDVQPDFVVAAGYKWLLGPYSVGFLYASADRHDGTPLEYNWITRKDSEDFAGLVDYRDEFQPGAQRYDVGESSNFSLLPMALAAQEQIHDWGPKRIGFSLGELTQRIVTRARPLGFHAPAQHAPHFVGLHGDHAFPDDLLPRLASHGVHVSRRGRSIRIAPHLYNDAEDVDRLMTALEDALS